MNYKNLNKLLWICIAILIVSACNNKQIETNIKAEIHTLTDAEFDYVGTKGIENPQKEDFREFVLLVETKNFKELSDYEVILPDFKEIINSIDGDRYWSGNGGNYNGKLNKEFVFFSRGLNEDDIKNAFRNKIIKITWKTKGNENKVEQFDVSEFIQFIEN